MGNNNALYCTFTANRTMLHMTSKFSWKWLLLVPLPSKFPQLSNCKIFVYLKAQIKAEETDIQVVFEFSNLNNQWPIYKPTFLLPPSIWHIQIHYIFKEMIFLYLKRIHFIIYIKFYKFKGVYDTLKNWCNKILTVKYILSISNETRITFPFFIIVLLSHFSA